jgi:hypothetical protein
MGVAGEHNLPFEAHTNLLHQPDRGQDFGVDDRDDPLEPKCAQAAITRRGVGAQL